MALSREVEQHHRPEWHCIQALLPEQAAQQMSVPLGRRLPRRCSGTVFRTVPFRLSRSQTVWHRPHGVPAQFVAARGKSADRRTEMFVWQQAKKSRSVGPSGRATKLEQKTIVFSDNIDLSRGGTMHVLSPHKRKVSNPVSNEEAREVASVCMHTEASNSSLMHTRIIKNIRTYGRNFATMSDERYDAIFL